MEYLLDHSQISAAAHLLSDNLPVDDVEKEIEQLRAAFYQLQFNPTSNAPNVDEISRRAYILATLASSPSANYESQTVGKALSVAAVIFEYLSQLVTTQEERLNYAINAILFYSRGEQEAQSATLAKRALSSNLSIEKATSASSKEAWTYILVFLSRDLKQLLAWSRENAGDLYNQLYTQDEMGLIWAELLQGCINTAKALVWGDVPSPLSHFDQAVAHAQELGDTRLTWLGITIREVAQGMLHKSIRRRLIELGIPGWAAEALTLDSYVEMWLPHREAFQPQPDLPKGILSESARISLINLPTSAGKSLIAEIAILSELTHSKRNKAIWIVPSRALVFEVQNRLSDHFRRIGIRVSSLPGGLEMDPEDDEAIESSRVFILTPEKLGGLLRRKPDILESVGLVVIDEMHKLGEGGRGLFLECVIAWLLLSADGNPSLRLLFMSAVLPNLNEFEVWLREQEMGLAARWSTWRPTRLALFSTTGGSRPNTWQTKLIQRQSQVIVARHYEIRMPGPFDVSLSLLKAIRSQVGNAKNRVLIFYYTKEDVNGFVDSLSESMSAVTPTPPIWAALATKFAAVYGAEHSFPKALLQGIGIDHGDIPIWLRQAVEAAYRSGELPTIIANQAILDGVNLPIDDMIIGSLGSGAGRFFRFRLRMEDFANLVGRAGRALVNTEGRCFLVWQWSYENVQQGQLSWRSYATPTPEVDKVHSTLFSNEEEFVSALVQLTYSLEGINESLFDDLGVWRDRLERLHSFSLAILEQSVIQDYSQLVRWLQKTFAWHQLSSRGRLALNEYAEQVSKNARRADQQLYQLASVSGLSVRSAEEIREVAQDLISSWKAGRPFTFEDVFSVGQPSLFRDVFTKEQYDSIVNVREAWRGRPVVYRGTYVPKVDHYKAADAWISGEPWTVISRIICRQHRNLKDNTQAQITASYVSQMFEFRLPWVLGALAISLKQLDAPQDLSRFVEVLPSFIRYGVNSSEAVTISKASMTDRGVSQVLAQKYVDLRSEGTQVNTWLQNLTLNLLREWLPNEPDLLLRDLLKRFHRLRERARISRRSKTVVELHNLHEQNWSSVSRAIEAKLPIEFSLRSDSNNSLDYSAVAVDATLRERRLQVGFLPPSYSEDVKELLDWGRNVDVRLSTQHDSTSPKIELTLLRQLA
jgi:helicase